jgi:hypothetical protein
MKPYVALGLWAMVCFGCSRARPPEDPGAKLYHDAVVLFATLSDETHDLSYRDPRFDDVMSLCSQVPTISDIRPKADALAGRIREARVEAEAHDKESAAMQARALAPIEFQAQPGVPLPATVPVPAGVGSSPQAANHGASSSATPSYQPRTSTPIDPAKRGQLPDWYRQKGYFGLKPDAPPGSKPPATSAATAAIPGSADPAAQRSAVLPSRAAPPPDSQAPPAVFGLPGPAGRAFQPPPPPQ